MTNNVYRFLRNKKFKLSLVLFLALAWVDLLSLVWPNLGKAGVIIWFLSICALSIVALKQLLSLVKVAWKTKNFASLLSLLIILVLAAFNMTQARSISGETTQEVACALEHFKKSIDWGYQQSCFLGYSARQYYLPALPSLILGRNQLALNLGGTLYFWLGISLFIVGVLKSNQFRTKQDLAAAAGIISVLHFYFFNHFFFNQFEQSIFPLSLGLAGFGLYLLFRKTSEIFYLPLIGVVLHWLVYAYTPSLALIPLLIFLLFVTSFKLNKNRKTALLTSFLVVLAIIGINLPLSFQFRHDVRLFGEENQITNSKPEFLKIVQHFSFKPQEEPFFSTSFTIIFWSTLVLSLILIPSLETIGLIAWTLAAMFAATFSQGYAYYHLAFRAHRALVIFPATIYLFYKVLTRIKTKKILFYGLYLLLLIDGLRFSHQYLNNRQPDPYLQVITSLEKNSNLEDEQQKQVYFSQSAMANIGSLADFTQYFWPKTSIKTFSPEEKTNCLPKDYDYLVLDTSQDCWNTLRNDLPISILVKGFTQTKENELVLLKSETTPAN